MLLHSSDEIIKLRKGLCIFIQPVSKHNECLLAFDVMLLLILQITCSPAVGKAAMCVCLCVCMCVSVVAETESAVKIQIHSQIHRGIAVSEYCWFV